jgi:hypothetical protein
MKFRVLFGFIVIAALIAQVCHAGVKKEIRFSPGSTTAVVKESVVRGERDFYYLTAKAGQDMEVEIKAVEENAAVQIYQPGYKIGTEEIKGATLLGAGEEDDATQWKGKLPVSGKYLFVVGGTRGNATYELKVTVR